MPMCEKCWADAYRRSFGTPKSQTECYYELLDERKDNPCSKEQQEGVSADTLESEDCDE